MTDFKSNPSLLEQLNQLNHAEKSNLHHKATLSIDSQRRSKEDISGYRQNFALDADRILHSRAYSRYIDKTQVFSLVENDHITHRVLHVQLVARIARTIGRFLSLNEDLIEAIALGHDIGHPPFGHDGEKFLSELCVTYGLPPFQHNIQSVRLLDTIERKGKGWNLSLQVLDGILCHDGEVHFQQVQYSPVQSFEEFDKKLLDKSKNPKLSLIPGSLEGCVVRMADTIAYIGRDIEDAIILGIINRSDLPKKCTDILGNSNGNIVYALVTDLIENSMIEEEKASIGFSSHISDALLTLKRFNYENIYLSPEIKIQTPLIANCYKALFEHYLRCLDGQTQTPPSSHIDLMEDIKEPKGFFYSNAERVRDFISGMTDDFFIQQAQEIGCLVPIKTRQPAVRQTTKR